MKVLVTGGAGFLGAEICRMIRASGADVRSLTRSRYLTLEALGVEQFSGDLADAAAVARAAEGVEGVFHVAAKAGVWGAYRDYYETNVTGTRNVLDACRSEGVRRLVYTSTPSVTFRGEDEEGVNESEPYAERFLCHYARTKAEAEQMVLASNSDRLATVALRPHLIWGPGDNHLVPRILERARRGRLRLVGKGDRLVDSTYITNAALAHLQAYEALEGGADCAGNAYYISNGEPLPMRELLNHILAAAALPPVTRSVPAPAAYAAGALLEGVYGLLGKQEEPVMTRFVARQLSTAHWFDISAARRDFGYTPEISLREGFRRLGESLGSA